MGINYENKDFPFSFLFHVYFMAWSTGLPDALKYLWFDDWSVTNTFPWICTCVLSHFSRVQLFATLWTVAHQAPLSMGVSRQEYWSGLTCPPGDLPNPRIKPASFISPKLTSRFFSTSATCEAYFFILNLNLK